MLGKKNQSAILAKYFSMYKKNPRSKVFAPLAESFRKLGMLDDAFKILKDGIRNHPNYTLGYIVLAHCYYDQGKYELAYGTLRPIISQNADNISLQKIFAQSCMNLGYLDEALDTYKYLLFMNPQDKFFKEQVKKLEDDLMVGHKKLSLEQLIKAPEMEKLPIPKAQDDDWVQVNFSQPQTDAEEKKKVEIEQNEIEWTMHKPGDIPGKDVQEREEKLSFKQHPILKEETIPERSLEDDFFSDEFEEYGDIEETNSENIVTPNAPIISHTLIDLYCAQKYYDKAIELLEKILELNPNDEVSRKKLEDVLELKSESTPLKKADSNEEEGHQELISIIESQVKAKTPKETKLEQALYNFLNDLKDRSLNYR